MNKFEMTPEEKNKRVAEILGHPLKHDFVPVANPYARRCLQCGEVSWESAPLPEECRALPNYCVSGAAAMGLVEWARARGYRISLWSDDTTGWLAQFIPYYDERTGSEYLSGDGQAAKLPTAITNAFLKANGVEV